MKTNFLKIFIFASLVLSSCGINGRISSSKNDASVTSVLDCPTGLSSSDLRKGLSLCSLLGTLDFSSIMKSNGYRDAGIAVVSNLTGQTSSAALTLENENTLYAGADLPTSGGYNYRDIPDTTKDDDTFDGTTCKYSPRPTINCGTTQPTILERIADCSNKNPSSSTWDGSVQCSRGQGVWKLVTRSASLKEVWQDQRTGLLWSSVVGSSLNWCQASGNTQSAPVTFGSSYSNAVGTAIVGNGTIGAISGGSSSVAESIIITFTSSTAFTVSGANCGGGSVTSGALTTTAGSSATWSRAGFCSFTLTQGSTNFAVNDKFVIESTSAATASCIPGAASGYQPPSPLSACAEVGSLAPTSGSENWSTGVYMTAKGGMGKIASATSPSVRWRLASVEDYMLANVNGIRLVMPDMGTDGNKRIPSDSSSLGNVEWTGSTQASDRSSVWYFNGRFALVNMTSKTGTNQTRCVGR